MFIEVNWSLENTCLDGCFGVGSTDDVERVRRFAPHIYCGYFFEIWGVFWPFIFSEKNFISRIRASDVTDTLKNVTARRVGECV